MQEETKIDLTACYHSKYYYEQVESLEFPFKKDLAGGMYGNKKNQTAVCG